jgi:hypothetical protein
MPNEDVFSKPYPSQQQNDMFPTEISLAIAYIPMQRITTLYDDENAYEVGTLFPDLDKPFLDGGVCNNGSYE